MQKSDDSNLFLVFEHGERRIFRSRPSAILLIGSAKAGASTVFNFITKRPMKVVSHPIHPCFENDSKDKGTAEISDSFASATLYPNVANLDEDVSIIDMPSMMGKRNYIKEMAAAYFYKSVFDYLRQIKFLLVIDWHKLVDASFDGIISTVGVFLSLFNIKNMNLDTRKLFYSSVALMITKSQVGHKYLDYLLSILKSLRSQELLYDKKEFIVELIQQLLINARFQCLPLPTTEKDSNQNTIIDSLNDKNWSFFHPEVTKKSQNIDVFANIFGNLSYHIQKKQKEQALCIIRSKANQFVKFIGIFRSFVNCIGRYTREHIQLIMLENQPININFSQVFFKIQQYLIENDIYDSKTKVKSQIELQGRNIALINQWKLILQICTYADNIPRINGQELQRLQNLYHSLQKLINLIKTSICSRPQESYLFTRFLYVLKRVFRDFSMIYNFQPQEISFYRNIVDYFGQCLQQFSNRQLSLLIFCSFKWKLLVKLFKSSLKISQYEIFFNQLLDEFTYRYGAKQAKKQFSDIQIAKAEIYLKENNQKEAILHYMSAYRYLEQIRNYQEQNQQEEYKKQKKQNEQKKQKELKELQLLILLKLSLRLKHFEDYNLTKNYIYGKYIICSNSAYYFMANIKLQYENIIQITLEIQVYYLSIKDVLRNKKSEHQLSEIIGRNVSLNDDLTIDEIKKLFKWETTQRHIQIDQPLPQGQQSSEYFSQGKVDVCPQCDSVDQKYNELRKILDEFSTLKEVSATRLSYKIEEISKAIECHRAKYPEHIIGEGKEGEAKDVYFDVMYEIEAMVKDNKKP